MRSAEPAQTQPVFSRGNLLNVTESNARILRFKWSLRLAIASPANRAIDSLRRVTINSAKMEARSSVGIIIKPGTF